MFLRIFMLIVSSTIIISCEKLTLLTTPNKKPVASQSVLAETAQRSFWDSLHEGQYEKIPAVEKLLTAAYLQNPHDPTLAAHLGFLHIWKITERNREKIIPPTIVDEIILAKKYFSDAVLLNPSDARSQGFLGDAMLIEGNIFQDQRQQVSGYFQLRHAIRLWPAFNYFTAGYPMSILDKNTAQFKEALNWQWYTLDLCAGTTIDRQHPDYRPYLSRQTPWGPLRACSNSWIAPHNFEGFFLNMGDMLVKQGHWQTAVQIYQNAKLSKTYSSWPYRSMLEKRMAHAQENVVPFQQPDSAILFNSGYGCVACHER